jgi:hypothetical protein
VKNVDNGRSLLSQGEDELAEDILDFGHSGVHPDLALSSSGNSLNIQMNQNKSIDFSADLILNIARFRELSLLLVSLG